MCIRDSGHIVAGLVGLVNRMGRQIGKNCPWSGTGGRRGFQSIGRAVDHGHARASRAAVGTEVTAVTYVNLVGRLIYRDGIGSEPYCNGSYERGSIVLGRAADYAHGVGLTGSLSLIHI